MGYYVVAEVNVTDDSWIPEYIENVTRIVEQHGGKYLARTDKAERLEGDSDAPTVFVLIEWPSREAAETFYISDAYQPYLANRKAGATSQLTLFPGEDIANA